MSKGAFALMAVALALNLLIAVAAVAPDMWRVGNVLLAVVFAYLLGRDED